MKKFRGLGLLIFLAVFAFATVVVMLLWNSVAVHIFSVPEITFWYSAGLIILSKLLFGGIHHFGHRHGHHPGCGHGRRLRCHHGERKRDGFDGRMEMLREIHEDFHSMSGRERREFIRRHMTHGFGDNREDKKTRNDTASGESGLEDKVDG